MKCALIGQGLNLIEAALYLHLEGAQVTVFSPHSEIDLVGPRARQLGLESTLKLHARWSDLTTSHGRKLAGLTKDLNQIPSLGEFEENYLKPLHAYLMQENLFRKAEVARVQKRFLTSFDGLTGADRMKDLFRVVTIEDGEESDLFSDPEFVEKVDLSVRTELKRSHELFHDFDLVIESLDAFGVQTGLGVEGSLALNEKFHQEKLTNNLSDFTGKTLAIIGSEETAAMTLLSLKEWLNRPGHQVSLITAEQNAFVNQNFLFSHALKEFLNELLAKWQKSCETFSQNLREWRELSDEDKKRMVKPSEPFPPLVLYEGFTVTAVDRLSDQDKFFLTFETPEFRNHGKEILKTLAVDQIISVQDRVLPKAIMPAGEPGYYQLSRTYGPNLELLLQEIFNDICQFFQKA